MNSLIKILMLAVTLFLSACATYYVAERQDDIRRQAGLQSINARPEESGPSIVDAVSTDIKIAAEAMSMVNREITKSKDKNDSSPLHSGRDSNMCEPSQQKVCALSTGCRCYP
ncbi:hypothetical protein SAMN02745866_01092 [Alteromonadaceae bacterium Bs31]|nr:hypothetical protein SAMN02745866_01092 [Alteromonadaceae bacterium Bs31]